MRIRWMIVVLHISLTAICYGQSTSETCYLSISKKTYVPVPPFPVSETRVDKNTICDRIILPPRSKMIKESLESYDMTDTIPKCWEVNPVDFDSLLMYITQEAISEIGSSYTEPDSSQELIVYHSGAGSEVLFIETDKGLLEYPISGAYKFELPKSISDLNELFDRISRRYINNRVTKPAANNDF